jgi:phosphoglycolate phosphatase
MKEKTMWATIKSMFFWLFKKPIITISGQKPVIIFDFDGTIADSFDFVINTINKYAPIYGYKIIENPQEIRTLSFTAIACMLHIPILKIPSISRKIKEDIKQNIAQVKPYTHIIPLLHHLKEAGYQLGIVTSNTQENVQFFLQQHTLTFFDFIHPSRNFLSKNSTLRKTCHLLNIEPHHALYIADEVRDIKAANACHMPVISVSWGFHARTLLEQLNKSHIIDNPWQLPGIIAQLFKLKN